jgi:uncharacterized membrane protein (UPF0127 family)
MLLSVRTTICLLPLAAAIFVGCKNDLPASTPPQRTAGPEPTAAAAPPLEIPKAEEGHPQPRLVTLKLWVGTNEVTAEIAHTMPQIMTGMMWRTNMAEMDGMLFVFGQPHRAQFWMRNTLLPLSCAYIDPEGTILETHEMKPRDETPIPAASDQVQFVLEMNKGWFERHGVTPGMLINTERGSLPQTLFRR